MHVRDEVDAVEDVDEAGAGRPTLELHDHANGGVVGAVHAGVVHLEQVAERTQDRREVDLVPVLHGEVNELQLGEELWPTAAAVRSILMELHFHHVRPHLVRREAASLPTRVVVRELDEHVAVERWRQGDEEPAQRRADDRGRVVCRRCDVGESEVRSAMEVNPRHEDLENLGEARGDGRAQARVKGLARLHRLLVRVDRGGDLRVDVVQNPARGGRGWGWQHRQGHRSLWRGRARVITGGGWHNDDR